MNNRDLEKTYKSMKKQVSHYASCILNVKRMAFYFVFFLLLFLSSDVLPNITYDVIQGTHDLGHQKGGGLSTTAFRRIKKIKNSF